MSDNYIRKNLRTDDENCVLSEKLLQGSTNRIFALTLYNRGKRVLLSPQAKISAIITYDPKIINGVKRFLKQFELKDGDPQYNITTEIRNDGADYTEVIVPFVIPFVDFAGNSEFILKIEETNSFIYSYSMMYFVAGNTGYTRQSIIDNLPSFNAISQEITNIKTNKADTTLANVSNEDFKNKVRATGIGTIESGAEIKAELEKLPVGERLNYEKLDNKPEMPLNAADVDLSNVSTEIFSEKVESTKAYNDLLETVNKGNEIIFTENGQEVHNKILHYNLTTGQLEVVGKVV